MEEGEITILASTSLELNGIALKLRESRWAELSFRIISIVLDLLVFTYNNNNIIEGKWIECGMKNRRYRVIFSKLRRERRYLFIRKIISLLNISFP